MNKAEDTNINTVRISEEVISGITEIAAGSIEGVCGFAKAKTSFSDLFSKKERTTAVSVKTDGDAVEVSVEINVSGSCRVKNTAEKIQQKVKDDIQSMTGIAVTKVNVFVKGIVIEDE